MGAASQPRTSRAPLWRAALGPAIHFCPLTQRPRAWVRETDVLRPWRAASSTLPIQASVPTTSTRHELPLPAAESHFLHPCLPRTTDERHGWLCKDILFVVGWGETGGGFPGLEEASLPEPALALPQDTHWGRDPLALEESQWGEGSARPEPPPIKPASGKLGGGSVIFLAVPFRPGAPKEEQSVGIPKTSSQGMGGCST